MNYTTRRAVIASPGGPMKLLVLQPKGPAPAPGRTGVLWIHGGGYITGMPEMVYMSRAVDLVRHCGAVVVSPDYRLSGKAPYPAALMDCHSALVYLKDHAAALGVRDDQLMVGGESAGGGLAAALCLYERDRGGVRIAFQMPIYPMLDNEDTETSRDNHAPVWNTRRNHYAWARYLRGVEGRVPAYAAPARAEDCAGLPPAYTFVSTAEPFYAEALTYVRRLREAGVEATVDVYEGLFHAFDMLAPFLPVSRRAAAAFERRFESAARRYFARQRDEQI
ncbi:MAG: alpha/beta hydrolase [Clostridiales bacterium]|nr:alpha/beta hydrolase [Clostridiales bacterium]